MFCYRLKDRSDEDGDDKIFGKVTSVAVEFLCVFLIAGEIFYDLEYETNPDISDVGDALYWSFLTLTGIGQVSLFSFAYGKLDTDGVFLFTAIRRCHRAGPGGDGRVHLDRARRGPAAAVDAGPSDEQATGEGEEATATEREGAAGAGAT